MEVKPATVVRTTKAYDGTTVLMSDTIANQQSYPNTAIKSRMWLSVSKTGGVVLCDNRSRFVAVAAFTTSEWKLARQLYATLQPGDVVVADSAYGTYVDLALVHSANADAVFRKRVTVIFVGAEVGHWRSYCPMAASWAMSSINAPEDFEHYQQASKKSIY